MSPAKGVGRLRLPAAVLRDYQDKAHSYMLWRPTASPDLGDRLNGKKNVPPGQGLRSARTGAVVLLSTALGERKNVTAISWLTVLDFMPPMLACVISGRRCAFDILSKPLECVINVPTLELAAKVVGRGNTCGRDTDTFKTFALTAAAASCVRPPLIDECYASIECKIVDGRRVDASDLFILEGCKAWITPPINQPRALHHRGKGTFMVPGETTKRPSRMDEPQT